MTFKNDTARAQKAEALLNDELYKEVFSTMRETLLKSIEDCPVRDMEGLHDLKLMLNLLKNLNGYMEEIVKTGKVAEFNLQMTQKRNYA